ncbi:MAG TPA: AlpA family phage regulatory protein [Caulobacteraceae bacterium]
MSEPIRFLRLPDVLSLIGVKKTQLYALVRKGEFPAPRKAGRMSYWPDFEVAAWQHARLAG